MSYNYTYKTYKTQRGHTIYVNPKRSIHQKNGEYAVYALEERSQLVDYKNWAAKVYFFKDSNQQSKIERILKKRGIEPENLLVMKGRLIGYLMRTNDRVLCYTERQDLVVVGTDEDSRVGDPGGQGEVFSLCPDTELYKKDKFVAKIYHNPPSDQQIEKLELLLKKRKEGKLSIKGVCFPIHILYKGHGKKKRCVGYLMERFYGDTLLKTVFQPHRIEEMLQWTRADICAFAETLLRRFIDLHKADANLLVGDINPKNVLVSYEPNQLAIIDTDSFQIDQFACPVYTKGFLPFRLQEVTDFSTVMRTREDEYYSIAVLLFEIFLIGKHPYARSDEGIFEEYIRDRNFVFPLGYGDNTLTPKGVYQLIWFNMPYEMRRAFYDTFHEGKLLTPAEWLPIIERYKRGLLLNRYPNDVFANDVKPLMSPEDGLSGLTMRDVNPDEKELNRIENVLCRDSNGQNEDVPFIQFGTYFIRCYLHRGNAHSSSIKIDSWNIDFIDSQGNFKVDEFLKSQASKSLEYWLNCYVWGIKPPVRVLYAFGGTLLRSLTNREAVIKALEDHFGIHFGVFSLDQEAELLIEECHRSKPILKKKPIMLIKQSSLAMRVIFKNAEGQISHYTFDNLGLLRMRNKLFSMIHPTMATQTMLGIHDKSINDQLKTIAFNGSQETAIIAVGVLKELMPKASKKKAIKELSLDDIGNQIDVLDEQLCVNRPYAQELSEDLELKATNFLEDNLNLRLGLPICAHIMKRLEVDHILLLHLGLGESVIFHTLNN